MLRLLVVAAAVLCTTLVVVPASKLAQTVASDIVVGGIDPSTPPPVSDIATPKPPIFRIVAPQVICKPPSKASASLDGDAVVELPKQITISMQTPGGQRLSYRVRMTFEVLGGFRGQQHSLKLWDSVRRLEHRINKRDHAMITDKNQINVNNTEVCEGMCE